VWEGEEGNIIMSYSEKERQRGFNVKLRGLGSTIFAAEKR